FLWRDTAYQRLAIQNHGDRPVDLRLTMLYDSDFADLFEVRGLRRERRGSASRRAIRPATTILGYRGLDARTRQTTLHFDAPPSKILHEMREGEMAALREVPFGLYYGTVDATPLFVMLAGLYAERTGDDATVAELWPTIEAALAWIDGSGDRDGDGFVEYH